MDCYIRRADVACFYACVTPRSKLLVHIVTLTCHSRVQSCHSIREQYQRGLRIVCDLKSPVYCTMFACVRLNKLCKAIIFSFHIFHASVCIANMAELSFGRNGSAEGPQKREVTVMPPDVLHNGACYSLWSKSTNIHVQINRTRSFQLSKFGYSHNQQRACFSQFPEHLFPLRQSTSTRKWKCNLMKLWSLYPDVQS